MSGFLTRLAARSLAATGSVPDGPAQLLVPRPMSLFEPVGPGSDEDGPSLRENAEAPLPRDEAPETGRMRGDADESESAQASQTRSRTETSDLERAPIAPRPPVDRTDAVPRRAATAATESAEGEKPESPPVADASAPPLVPRVPDTGSAGRRLERAPPRTSTEVGQARETARSRKGARSEPAVASPAATESRAKRPASSAPKPALVPPPRTNNRTPVAPVADRPLPALPRSPERRSAVADIGSRLRAREAAPEPVVHVSIGRVEIRAAPEAPAPRRPAARATRPPAISLGDYLARRDREARP